MDSERKKSILRQFQILKEEDSPLNFNYIRRTYPEFFKSITLEFPSFFSAQKAASLDPFRVKREYLQKIRCRICNREFVSLGFHLREIHQEDLNDYKNQYNEEFIESEVLRLKRRKSLNKDLHWEWIWSTDYEKEFIFEMQSRGVILDYTFFRDYCPDLLAIIHSKWGNPGNFLQKNSIKSFYVSKGKFKLEDARKMIEGLIQAYGYFSWALLEEYYGKNILLRLHRNMGTLHDLCENLGINEKYLKIRSRWTRTALDRFIRKELKKNNLLVKKAHWVSRNHAGAYAAVKKYYPDWAAAVENNEKSLKNTLQRKSME
jgi:hypothetical protein